MGLRDRYRIRQGGIMTAPIGNIVRLYFDTPRTLDEGDVVRSPTGRAYRIVHVRRQERGIHEGRWHVQGLVMDPGSVTADDNIFDYVWYPRRKARR